MKRIVSVIITAIFVIVGFGILEINLTPPANATDNLPSYITWQKTMTGTYTYTSTFGVRWRANDDIAKTGYGTQAYIYKNDNYTFQFHWTTPGKNYGWRVRYAAGSCGLPSTATIVQKSSGGESGNIELAIKAAECNGSFVGLIVGQKQSDGTWNESNIQNAGANVIYYIDNLPTAPKVTEPLKDKNLVAGATSSSDNFEFTSMPSKPFDNKTQIDWSGSLDGQAKTKSELEALGFSFNNNFYSIVPIKAGTYTLTATLSITDAIPVPCDSMLDNRCSTSYHLDATNVTSTIVVAPQSQVTQLTINPVPTQDLRQPVYDSADHCVEPAGSLVGSLCPVYVRHLGSADDNITTYVDLGVHAKDFFGNDMPLETSVTFDIHLCDGAVIDPLHANCPTSLWDHAVSPDPILSIAPKRPTGVWKIDVFAGALATTTFISVQGAAIPTSSTTVTSKAGVAGTKQIDLDAYPIPNAINCNTSPSAPGISLSPAGTINMTSDTVQGNYTWQGCTIWNTFKANHTDNHYSEPLDIVVEITANFQPTLVITPSQEFSELTPAKTTDNLDWQYAATDTSGQEVQASVQYSSDGVGDSWNGAHLVVNSLGERTVTGTATIDGILTTTSTSYSVFGKPVFLNMAISGQVGDHLVQPFSIIAFPSLLNIICENLPGDAHINFSNWSLEGTFNTALDQSAVCHGTNDFGTGPDFIINFHIIPKPKPSFIITDVQTSNPARDSIVALYQRGYTKGCSWQQEGTTVITKYCPKNQVKREQMAAFLYSLKGSPPYTPPANSPFHDLSTSNIFYTQIMWGVANGIWSGYSDGNFSPNRSITRAQFSMVLWKFYLAPSPSFPVRSPFRDLATNNVAYPAVIWGVNNGTIAGYPDGTFKPNKNITREQMALLIIAADNL
jgi:hypothetical protein